MYKLIPAVLSLSLFAVDAQAQDQALTTDEVLAMVAEVPVQLGHWRRAGFELKPDAPVIAAAIAQTADGSLLGTVREDAALMVVYAAYEGGMRKCPVGDGNRSWGTWQLQRSPWKVACTPKLAVAEWLSRAQYSMQTCSALPLEEQLSSLASGSCLHGRQLVRHRVEVARRIALLSKGIGE
jgi:hypothetical protein